MSIISQREVKEYSPQFKRAVILSIILSTVAVAFVLLLPLIKEKLYMASVRRDLKSIERVYNALQGAISDDEASILPSAMWDISLSDIETMYSLEDLKNELHSRLRVSDLRKLEGDGFKSDVFKGNKYSISMISNSKTIHLIVESNKPEVQENVEY